MLRVVELFSGYGSQAFALKNIGVDFVSEISEIDKYAIEAYNQLHGETKNWGDICQIESLDYFDLWTYSFPCFTEDSLVLTEERGFQKIKDINIGEKVLTHDGSYKTVENVINNGKKKTVKVYGMGVDEIHTTPNHLFYVREKKHIWNNNSRSYTRFFSEPLWKQADSLKRTDYVGVPVNNKSEIPEWNGITFSWSDGRKDRHKNQLSQYMNNKDFWWLIGRYVADGWFRNNGGIAIGCGKNKFIEMKEKCDSIGLNYNTSEERTTIKFHYPLKELELFVQPFGKYAHGKKIPSFVMNLPVFLLNSFLDGYISGDGCFTKGRFKATSVSRELIYGLAQCVAKVYKQPYSIYKTKRPKTTTIEGRIVNQRDTYEVCFKKEKRPQDKAFYEDGFIWFPVTKVEENEIETVYDLTVEENHSFTVQGVIVHNCQDLSQAGKQAGIKEGTRSGLLYEVERLLEDSVNKGKQPKYLLLENVKALVSKKFMPDFQRWLDKLEQLGYNNYWQVLNAKDYGIPQNRERVFVVSIRKDIDTQGYSFPEKQKLELRLKDMLESNVDEKYYLSDEKVSKLLNSGFNQEKARIQNKDCCDTLLARDYKDPKCIAELKDKEISNTIRCGGGGSLDGKHTWDIIAEPVAYDEQNGYVRKDGCVGTLTTDGSSPKHNNRVIEPLCAASRGRNPDNPSDRTVGSPTEQRLEIKYDGCTNTLTTVQKDNYIVEPKVIQVGNLESTGNWDNPQRGRVYSSEGCSPALNGIGNGGNLEPKVVEEKPVRIGNIYGEQFGTGYAGNVWDKNAICPALMTMQGGGREPMITEVKVSDDTNKRIRTLLRILWKEIREKKIWEEIGGFWCISKKEILRQNLHEKSISKERKTETNIFECTHDCKKGEFIVLEDRFLRDMWFSLKSRRPSQRWGLSKQQFRQFTSSMQKLSLETTPKEGDMYYMWKANESIWILRETLSEIQKIWKPSNAKLQDGYRIRKLTAKECWRLMGVKDEQFNRLHGISNTQLYKLAGNSIVVNVLEGIFRNLLLPSKEKSVPKDLIEYMQRK